MYVMENNKSGVEPVSSFSSCVGDYSQAWYDGYVVNCVECFESRVPFIVMLGVYGGVVEGFFDIIKNSKWRMDIIAFRSDDELIGYVKGNGLSGRCSEIILLDEEKRVVLGK